uniref:Potassium channel, subfamily K, member 12 like n=1 Tax=Mastacembelus armatus TaxID=205130 RepID=A0A7N8Y7L0_9TELE
SVQRLDHWAPMNEDNARFCLLAGLILLYLLCGAAIFSALEHPFELRARHVWKQQLENFTQRYRVNLGALHTLLRQYEEANGAGIRVDALRPRWDFSGAFYFVGTVVSTIGFGMTTPATIRIITMLAYIMRWCHERRLRCAGVGVMSSREERSDEEDSLEGWKPSVYYVMLILGAASIVIACSASTLYSSMENWSYCGLPYFCFVAFSTIGFGDLVSSQRQHYESQEAYRLGNCLFILMGVCCIYSLFNVISIVIKQTLQLDSGQKQRRLPALCDSETDGGVVADGVYVGRRLSGEMISVNEFMVSNKVHLHCCRKQLSETAHQGPRQSYGHQNGFSGGVGALAIMNNRLQETSVDR